ncbi:hypothetical protein FQN54_003637 [Arachnomyces sp. PD_36]|nr:hypothetical protein FQN54_003637 [Arachnomyces sp. PD_36]
MVNQLIKLLVALFVFGYGLFTLGLYALIAIWQGTFFKRPTEQENLEFELARDRLWNLSKTWVGLSHRFLTLKNNNNFKFHYVCTEDPSKPGTSTTDKPLIIFLHGFPDSWAIWRHLLSSSTIRDGSIVVAVDLPGYGGSDGMERYGATEVLDSLTGFVIAMREHYGIDSEEGEGGRRKRKVVIVAHDWGCVLAYRLAAEAPELADRFVVTNGPLLGLAKSNAQLLASSSYKMLKTYLNNPLSSRSTLVKALSTLRPLFKQLRMSGYIFAFQLPLVFVRYLGTGGNYAFLKGAHKLAGSPNAEYTIRDAAESMASTLGPGPHECKTANDKGETYPERTEKRAKGNFADITAYYRDGTGSSKWHKSAETVAALYSIEGPSIHRASSGAGIFDEQPEGALRAKTTVIWGQQDTALSEHVMLEGIGDYLVQGSQVIMLPRTGHFTPMERGGSAAIEKVVEWSIKGEKGDIGTAVKSVYPGSVVTVRK